ncbi:SDR family oxidoreductase [Cupriavidus sp. CV2]|uniref:SDR family NAD(P)-dependent oxidoreductase n=1 Tax=Cupriavidus ulmosensis TaxID=3065913 RepID=UPI00296AD2A3|nr:SDR family oxidoreductase [Cupriavidus sp. CV2]MDW3682742.1 SDR family oxidoreductase [Cupriavidus sp. CV2]
MHSMTDGCVVVTGASRGIGAAIAAELANNGFQVACLSRSGDLPVEESLTGEVRARMFAVACDITDQASLKAAFDTVATSTERPIVGLVNNAGVHLQGKSASFPLADYERVMTTNATSVLSASQVAHPFLVAAGSALIVNIGSFFDKLGVKGNVAYCASKAAVGAITRCLAVEWASAGIRVLNVAPGYIETDLNREELNSGPLHAFLEKRIPTGGPGNAQEIAGLVTMLFQLPGHFLTGETLYIDGGQGMAL